MIFLITPMYASIIEVGNETTSYDVLENSSIYIDHTRSLGFNEIKNGNITFELNNARRLLLGYSPNFDVWIKFTVKNTTDTKISRILEYNNPMTTNIFFYSPDENFSPQTSGILSGNLGQKSINSIFKINLEAHEEKTYFIKVYSEVTTLIVDLKLWKTNQFYEAEIDHQKKLALFFGAMIALALYNLSLYFFTRDKSYLYYVAYMIGISFHHIVYTGFFNIFQLDVGLNELMIKAAAIIVGIPAFALALFTNSMLEMNRYPKLKKLLHYYLILFPLTLLIFVFTNEFNHFRNIFSVILLLLLLFITVYAALKKDSQAKFILFGWFLFIVAGSAMYLSSIGWFDIYKLSHYFIEILLVLEAIVFSIALAYRIKQLQLEKESVHQKLLEQQKNEKVKLEHEVLKKTEDLQEALATKQLLLNELNHRVKNSMQTILSLIRMQSDEFDNTKLQDAFTTIQNRVSTMSHLHELLYKEELFSDVNAFQYFHSIVEDIQESYEMIVEINYQIHASLEIEQAIYCGLIVNELVTNACKYAFKDDKGTISIALDEKDNVYSLIVSDNGMGYDQGKTTNSLGLELVKSLVYGQLKGKISTDSHHGVSVEVIWSILE
ncbi:MAG: 7TM diverse intracellular signaling domain-containing protein [Sulfuricurvum sp.]